MKVIKGLVFVSIFAIVALLISKIDFVSNLGISSLVIGIILGSICPRGG